MKIAIDNSDYTAALDAVRPLTIERKLNEPSTCRFWLTLAMGGALAVPLRNQAVAITGDDGTVYFTGYLAVSPLPEYVGLGLAGPVYRLELQAVSDEILLDSQLLPPSAGTTGATVGQLMQGLVARTGLVSGMPGALRTTGLTLGTAVSQFVPEAGAKFSRLAGMTAAQGRAAYRASQGTLALSQVGSTVHALNEANGTLMLANLSLTAAVERALANDVTVCGAEEPVAYVTEYFLGDGVTLVFPLAAASSLNLIGTMRSLFLKGLGTQWVSSIAPGGTLASAQTLPVATLVDGAVCHLTRTGFLTFYTGYAPALGTVVAVLYRSVGRAVGRAVNAASQSALLAAGSPATAVWTGSVTEPKGRSSQDCRNAATALVTAAASVSAAWSGSYKTNNVALNAGSGLSSPTDVWPGDALLLESASLGLDVQVVVRSVILNYSASRPDVVQYAIVFSNDWANDLSIKTSRPVPEDAWLPAVVAPAYLANLDGLTVTAISPSAVSVNTGVAAPSGGGFEVRRRDFAFQAGTDPDLVIRSVVSTFDIPRATESDRFYVRTYDGSTPPNYSEFSVGLFVNLPLSTTV